MDTCFNKNERHIFCREIFLLENAQATDVYFHNTTWMTNLKDTWPISLTHSTRWLCRCLLFFLQQIANACHDNVCSAFPVWFCLSDHTTQWECIGLDNRVSLVLSSRLAFQFALEKAWSSKIFYIYHISIDFGAIYIPEAT